jgi:hypothetical protein
MLDEDIHFEEASRINSKTSWKCPNYANYDNY